MNLQIAIGAALALLVASADSTRTALQDHDCAGTLRGFIQEYLALHSDMPPDPKTKVVVARTTLGVRAPQAYVVYFTSGGWCGSGGCHTLIVSKTAGRFGALGFIPATELPISIERATRQGDAAIVVMVKDMAHGGLKPAMLTRQEDSYGYHHYVDRSTEEHPEPLISADATAVSLY